jgi:hypothetical protein
MSLTDEDKNWIAAAIASATAGLATHQDLEALADKNREQLERLETSLLTAFHKWASPRPGATTECATYPG